MSAPPPDFEQIRDLDPRTAARRLADSSDAEIADRLTRLRTGHAVEVLEEFDPERRERIAAATPFGQGQLWLKGHAYAEGTVGRLIERPPAVFRPDAIVARVVEELRETVKRRIVSYIFVTEADGTLVGVVAFRELLFASR
ncbi:MAG: CBS domain-containing protein, partial [Pseudomonadota bacterium]